ncbi:MAG: alpha-ketoacid dehydrogenase subunit beta, partial [Bacillota bacterium]
MREITYAQAVREALAEEMRRDERVFLMGEDIGVYGGAFGVTLGLIDEFGPERVMDTPLSEAAIIGAAAGAAVLGMRPVAEVQFSDFLTIGSDQLVNQAAKMRYMFGGKVRVPMVVRTPAGSGTGAAAQHSQSLETWFMHIPGLKVVAPATPYDAKGLLKSAIRDDNPVVVFEHKLLYKTKGPVPEEDYTVPIGKAAIRREGTDITVIATSVMVLRSLAAADRLAEEGISVEVIDLRSLRPLDTETIVKSVCKTGRAVVVHEANKFAGFGGEIVGT